MCMQLLCQGTLNTTGHWIEQVLMSISHTRTATHFGAEIKLYGLIKLFKNVCHQYKAQI